MNKKVVDQEIPYAYEALKKIADENSNVIKKSFQGQIAAFGAAVSTGSLLAAVCFFSNSGKAEVDRSKLMDAIVEILKKRNEIDKNEKRLAGYVQNMMKKGQEQKAKEEIINAAIALKLAMNLYTLKDDEE